MLDSKTIQVPNERASDRRRAREKLREKVSQSSTNRVTYEKQLKAIHSRSSRQVPSRAHMDGPGCSTRKSGGSVEQSGIKRSYAEAVRSGTFLSKKKVGNPARSDGSSKGADSIR